MNLALRRCPPTAECRPIICSFCWHPTDLRIQKTPKSPLPAIICEFSFSSFFPMEFPFSILSCSTLFGEFPPIFQDRIPREHGNGSTPVAFCLRLVVSRPCRHPKGKSIAFLCYSIFIIYGVTPLWRKLYRLLRILVVITPRSVVFMGENTFE